MTLWVTFAVMSLVAIGFVAWPLYKSERRLTPLLAVTIAGIVGLSAGLYYKQGEPDIPSGAATAPEPQHINDDAVAALAGRLRENPDDVAGWLMLGRSYSVIGNIEGANEAFERAVAIEPDNPEALFYSGAAAANRNDLPLAATRWERLLSQNPPAEIEPVLRRQVAEWRGEVLPEAPPQAAPEPAPKPVQQVVVPDDAVVGIELSLSGPAQSALSGNMIVFIIARDPAQPSPPIAVTRRQVAELPAVVYLGDGESMVPGRNLSGFAEFEVVARVSVSGQRNQQSGDWFGSVVVTPAENDVVSLTISEQAP